MKCHILKMIGIFLLLLIFTVSVIPITAYYDTSTDDLSTAILKMQLLENTQDSSKTNFTVVFSDTLTAFKIMAGFKQIDPNIKNDPIEKGATQITVCIKVPLFLVNTQFLNVPGISEKLLPTDISNYYESIDLAPATPPPIQKAS